MWPIIKITYREMISKRIFTITVLMSLAFLLLFGVATWFAAREFGERLGGFSQEDLFMEQSFVATQLLGMGLYFGSFITALLAILSSVGSISSEVESHQIDTWLARSLPRHRYLLGKFLGLASMLVLYAVLMFLGLFGINQWIGGSVMGVDVSAQQILVCVALLLSSMTTTVTGGIIMIILYGMSFIGGFVEQLGTIIEKDAMVNIGIVSSLLFPTDTLFRQTTIALFETAEDPLSFAMQGFFGSASTPSDAMLVYTVCYGLVALWLAMRMFAKRDV
jgi:Cu-processing system permease protein